MCLFSITNLKKHIALHHKLTITKLYTNDCYCCVQNYIALHHKLIITKLYGNYVLSFPQSSSAPKCELELPHAIPKELWFLVDHLNNHGLSEEGLFNRWQPIMCPKRHATLLPSQGVASLNHMNWHILFIIKKGLESNSPLTLQIRYQEGGVGHHWRPGCWHSQPRPPRQHPQRGGSAAALPGLPRGTRGALQSLRLRHTRGLQGLHWLQNGSFGIQLEGFESFRYISYFQ